MKLRALLKFPPKARQAIMAVVIPIPIRHSFYKFSTGELLPSNFFSGNKIISKLSYILGIL